MAHISAQNRETSGSWGADREKEKLMRQSNTHSVGIIETMSDRLFAGFENAVDSYAMEDEGAKP